MQKQSETDTERPAGDQKKIELSGTQVAGSAAATVVTAFLASSMGVYGTIIGAGVVSVGATAGGAVFQHFFRRTGEQIREKAVVHGPKASKVTKALPALNRTSAATPGGVPAEAPEAAGAPRTLQATQLMPQADETALLGAGGPDDGDPATAAPADAGYGDATVHGSAKRGMRWKRIALTAAGVFALGLGTITAVEALAGESMSDVWGRGNGSGTSVGSIFGGGGGGTSTDDSVDQKKDQDKQQDEQPGGGATDPTTGTGDDGATDPSTGATEGGEGGGRKPDPGSTTDPGGDSGDSDTGDGGKVTPTPTPKPSTSDGGGATPESGSTGDAGADARQPRTDSSAG